MELFQITSTEQLEEFRDIWSHILEENENTNPFIEFEWLYEWWKHLGHERQVEIIAVQNGEKIVAFFPFLIKKRLIGYTYNFMALGQANYMDVIAYEHLLESAIEYVFDEIVRTRKNVVFHLHGLLESSKTTKLLEAYLRKRKSVFSVHRVITPFIDLENIKLSEYMKKRKKLHHLDRKEKRLQENGGVEFLPSKPEEMEYIFTLHDKQWKKKKDTSGFTNEKEKAFFKGLAQNKEGTLQTDIHSLYINNKMIAFKYGFKCRGRYVSYVLGYDDDFKIFSPGRILEKEMILECKRGTVKNFDLSIGYEPYKFEWNTHHDYTREIIFSSDAITANATRYLLSMKALLRERVKKNYRLVLFKRNTIGKLHYVLKNLFSKSESKDERTELKELLSRTRKYLFERKQYIVYKMNTNESPDFSNLGSFTQLTIHDALNSPHIASKDLKEICRKMYGGYKGYYSKDILSLENIFWTNEKVLRIENLSYFENLRKSSVYVNNWREENLVEICSFIMRHSKTKTIYVSVEDDSKSKIAALESVGFLISKYVFKRTFFNFGKTKITELESLG